MLAKIALCVPSGAAASIRVPPTTMDTSASAGASGDTATTLLNEMTATVPDEPSRMRSSEEPLAAVTWTLSMLAQSAGTAAQ